MKRIVPLIALLLIPACAPRPPVRPTPSAGAPVSPTRASLERQIDGWLPGMGAANLVDREQPQQEFEQLCFAAGRPGAESERTLLCQIIAARLGSQTPRPARIWLLRQLERLGRDESVAAVAKLLDENDGEIRDLARRVLQNNPAPAAAAALRKALQKASESAWQVALINALAARHDPAAVSALAGLADQGDPSVAAAAIAGLADIGNRRATDALCAVWRGPDQQRREWAAAALIRVADQMVADRQAAHAADLYAMIYNPAVNVHLRAAALRGLASSDPEQATPALLDTIRGKRDPELRLLAVRLIADIPGAGVTQALLGELPNVPPEVQVVMLDALAGRADRAVKPAIVKTLTSTDSRVRIAALQALEQIGDADDIVTLGLKAAEATGPERDAARHSLARLRGPDLDNAILADLKDADPPLRAELIRALAARWCQAALPTFFLEARHPEEAVRVAALNALGDMAAPAEAPDLVHLLVQATGDADRSAAEDAVVAVCNRIETPEKRAEPVLEQWAETPAGARPTLIAVLGRLGGAAALEKIRAARGSGEVDLVDAAVRALAQWSTTDVLDDLLDIARHSDSKTQRVLALGGYIRLVGLPSEREPQATAAMYATAWPLAERPEEKKQILSGLSNVPHGDALRLAQESLKDEGLRAEAENAVISVARVLGPWDRETARTAINDVLAQTTADATRENGRKALEAIEKAQGCILTWSVAGPYSQEGQEWAAILDTAFPPEKAEPGVKWRPLKTTNVSQPWVFDLTRLDSGSHRCVYVRSAVWSARAQDARLEVGSDDAVKVWLNGQLVHEFRTVRAHEPLQDHVAVKLQAGWNMLLLKVVQATGGWGFSAALRTPEGEPLGGLKFQAEPPTAP